jgi:hypothetical protein
MIQSLSEGEYLQGVIGLFYDCESKQNSEISKMSQAQQLSSKVDCY